MFQNWYLYLSSIELFLFYCVLLSFSESTRNKMISYVQRGVFAFSLWILFFWMQFQFYWISISAHEQSIQKTVRGKKNISRKNNVFNIEYCLTIIVFSLPLSPECVLSNDNNHGAISTVNTQSRTNPTRTCVVSIYFCEAFRVFWRLATLKYGFDSMAAKKLVNISMEINIWVECLLKKNTRP